MRTGAARGETGYGGGVGAFRALKHGCNAFWRVLDGVLGVFGLPVATLPVSYTSVSYINSAFPMISSVSNISSGVIHQYAGTVEAEINAKISKRYSLPLTADCPILTAIATRETIYRIAVQRQLVQFPPAQQGQHPMLMQHKDDQELLKQIMDGELQLVTASNAVVAADITQLEIYSTTKGYVPTFHEGSWGDQIQDESKLDDIVADRGL